MAATSASPLSLDQPRNYMASDDLFCDSSSTLSSTASQICTSGNRTNLTTDGNNSSSLFDGRNISAPSLQTHTTCTTEPQPGHSFPSSRIYIDLTADSDEESDTDLSTTAGIHELPRLADKNQRESNNDGSQNSADGLSSHVAIGRCHPSDPVKFFTVIKQYFSGWLKRGSMVEDMFLDQEEANLCARTQAEKECLTGCTSFINFSDQNHLYRATTRINPHALNAQALHDSIAIFIDFGQTSIRHKRELTLPPLPSLGDILPINNSVTTDSVVSSDLDASNRYSSEALDQQGFSTDISSNLASDSELQVPTTPTSNANDNRCAHTHATSSWIRVPSDLGRTDSESVAPALELHNQSSRSSICSNTSRYSVNSTTFDTGDQKSKGLDMMDPCIPQAQLPTPVQTLLKTKSKAIVPYFAVYKRKSIIVSHTRPAKTTTDLKAWLSATRALLDPFLSRSTMLVASYAATTVSYTDWSKDTRQNSKAIHFSFGLKI
jgi:hypothetical protein